MYRQIPFFRLLLPFAVGIILALNVSLPFSYFYLTISLVVLLVLILATYFFQFSWAYRWVFGILVSSFLLLSGIVLTHGTQTESQLTDGEESQYLVRLLEPVEVRKTSQRTLAQVTSTLSNDVWIPVREKVMLYFSATDSLVQTLDYGSVIALQAKFASPPEPINPNQFNHREYLSKKQIHRVAFVPSDRWFEVDYKANSMFAGAYKVRSRMLALFQRVGIEGENLAVLSALTMGYKSLLDQETQRVFSASGAMHILAVSGLHVGILFSTLSAFLFFLSRIKRGKLLKAFVLISFLWLFALFTGLSPSVIRASLMFSLVILGTAFNHSTNIYNTLSSSAFVILAFNPMLITEVGFQLSYLAVVSIVFFYPHFYKAFYVRNKLIDKVWALVCVSLAAQLGTFVLGLFYFNQFPNYFLLTNLFAIPLAFIILYLAIALIVFSFVPFLDLGIGWFLDKALSLLNSLIRITEGLPLSTSTGISISISQAVYLFIAIIMLALFLENKRIKYLYGVLAFTLVFFIEQALISTINIQQSETVVFGQRQATLIGFKQGKSMVISTSDSLIDNLLHRHSFSIGGYLNAKGIKPSDNIISISSNDQHIESLNGLTTTKNPLGRWFFFNNKSILVPLGDSAKSYVTSTPLPVDLLLITNQSKVSINSLFALVSPDVVVVDATVPPWQIERIEEQLSLQGQKSHFITKHGAYILR